jgi:hypothetical protein
MFAVEAAVVRSQGRDARSGVREPLISMTSTALTGAAFMDERTAS